MGEVATIGVGRDIGETEDVELLLTTTASSIDGEQDRPGDAASNEHDGRDQLQESQQEVRIHGMVLEYVSIGKLVHRGDPTPEAGGGFRGALP